MKPEGAEKRMREQKKGSEKRKRKGQRRPPEKDRPSSTSGVKQGPWRVHNRQPVGRNDDCAVCTPGLPEKNVVPHPPNRGTAATARQMAQQKRKEVADRKE